MDFDAMVRAAKSASESFPLVSIKQVSVRYGLSVRTLRRMQAAGKMPAQRKHGRRKMYLKAEIEQVFGSEKNNEV